MEETRAADEANADVIETAYEPPKPNEPALNKYFKACIKMKVSDLHLKADQPAYVRHKGDLRAMTGGPLSDEFIKAGIMELLSASGQRTNRNLIFFAGVSLALASRGLLCQWIRSKSWVSA